MNTRHSMFGYSRPSNPKGRQLYKLVFENKLNYIGPGFPTYFSYNNIYGTKPDSILTNNKFYFNYHIQPGGMGPSDHMTINLIISCKPILVNCSPREDYQNTNWKKYTDCFLRFPVQNFEGKFITDIDKEINCIYEKMSQSKANSTPIITFKRVRTSQTSMKFKRLTKILDTYCIQLLTNGKTPFLDRKINETKNLLVTEGNAMKYIWFEEQLCKVEAAAKDNSKFWRHINRIQGKPSNQIPLLKSIIDGSEIEANSTEEKINLLTNIWSSIYQISFHENQNFCLNNERKVSSHLSNIVDKITTKFKINLNELENENVNLKIDIDDIKLAIKTLKDKCPGPSGLRKKTFL